MVMTLSEITTLVRLVQELKADASRLMTLLPIVTSVRLLQDANAQAPMLVTLSGIANIGQTTALGVALNT